MNTPSTTELRQRGRRARRNLPASIRALKSDAIQRRFLRSGLFLSSKTIACYLSTPDEVDTSMIFARAWKARKRVFAPVISGPTTMRFVEVRPETELRKNRYGLWEPVSGAEISAREIDVVIVPTVAFDASRERIGMGGGYFDRAFAFLKNNKQWSKPKLVGLAFDCQEVEKITPNHWDIRLYRFISETGDTIRKGFCGVHV